MEDNTGNNTQSQEASGHDSSDGSRDNKGGGQRRGGGNRGGRGNSGNNRSNHVRHVPSKGWKSVEQLALHSLESQKKARRRGVFFHLSMLTYVVFIFLAYNHATAGDL